MFINVCVKTFGILEISWRMAELEGGYFCTELNGLSVYTPKYKIDYNEL